MSGRTPEPTGDVAELSFEEALARLVQIVEELEGGQMPLEEALQRFQEGVRLRATCMEKLERAEAKIEQVLAETAKMAEGESEVEPPEDDPA
jgi:exodeoxyribonuclease VII small subunit